MSKYNIKLLFKHWNDKSVSNTDLAMKVGCHSSHLPRLGDRYGLPKRKTNSAKYRGSVIDEMTPQEVELRKKWVRAESLRKKREETDAVWQPARARIWTTSTQTGSTFFREI